MRVEIIVAGDWQHPEFSAVAKSLPTRSRLIRWEAGNEYEGTPDLLVMAQARRNQVAPQVSQQVLAKWPTTPAVQVLSSWCEGEIRSGRPNPGWVRVLWHRWPTEFDRFIEDRGSGRTSAWDRSDARGNPATMAPSPWTGGRCLEIGVDSRWTTESMTIEAMMTTLGHVPRHISAWLPESGSRPLDACLIVADSYDAWLEASLIRSLQVCRRGLKLVVMGFPRPHEVERMRTIARGPVQVLAKPFEVGQVQRLLQSRKATRGIRSGDQR